MQRSYVTYHAVPQPISLGWLGGVALRAVIFGKRNFAKSNRRRVQGFCPMTE